MNADRISEDVRIALAEDVGPGDITAALTRAEATTTAILTLKQDAVVCGIDWFEEAYRQLDGKVSFDWTCRDGDELNGNIDICELRGPVRAILTGERTALNFLQTLSATATSARRFVAAIAGTGAIVLDTRKTLPGLRSAQKYAVRCGGASNHRFGLFDAILIKENHIAAMGSISAAIEAMRTSGAAMIEIEVETLEHTERALRSAADRLLLDNFSLNMLRRAVAMRNDLDPGKELEASGDITLANARDVAETGVDYLSVGAITKSVDAVDYSMRVVDRI